MGVTHAFEGALIAANWGNHDTIIPSSTDHMIDDFTECHAGAQTTIRLHKFFDLFLVIY